MLRKCYNRNTFVTNDESGKNWYNVKSGIEMYIVNSGKNSYIVKSGTKKDITTSPDITTPASHQNALSSATYAYTRTSELVSCKLGAGKLKGEATMKKYYKVEGISKDGHKVIDCTCYTTREDAEKAIANGNYLMKNNKVYARITEIEA